MVLNLNQVVNLSINNCENSEKKPLKDNLLIFIFNCAICLSENSVGFSEYDLIYAYLQKINQQELSDPQKDLINRTISIIKSTQNNT